jgi:hypothetical protein
MARRKRCDSPPAWVRRFDDELIGLDPDDPEARAFAQHLDRMQRQRPGYTVEGYLDGMKDFAESANRAQGLRWWFSLLLVTLLLLGAVWAGGKALLFVLETWL